MPRNMGGRLAQAGSLRRESFSFSGFQSGRVLLCRRSLRSVSHCCILPISFWTHYCYCCSLVIFSQFFPLIQPMNSLLFVPPLFRRGGGRWMASHMAYGCRLSSNINRNTVLSNAICKSPWNMNLPLPKKTSTPFSFALKYCRVALYHTRRYLCKYKLLLYKHQASVQFPPNCSPASICSELLTSFPHSLQGSEQGQVPACMS